jgi:lysophospholipase L1-like esterase
MAMSDGAPGIRSDLTPDGVHPSQAGYRVMEPLTIAAIIAALRPAKRWHLGALPRYRCHLARR